MMTEAEALTKWCPLVRIADWPDLRDGPKPVAVNRRVGRETLLSGVTTQDATFCIGSACMAWREIRRFAEPNSGYCGAFGLSEASLRTTHTTAD